LGSAKAGFDIGKTSFKSAKSFGIGRKTVFVVAKTSLGIGQNVIVRSA